ncbi:hypothetical protein NDU88_005040, partial [Pleurodeles waltl]
RTMNNMKKHSRKESRVLPIRMPPCKCQKMVAHNEQHELHTRSESGVSQIRMPPCKCQE